jgi:adenine deaminase
MEETMDLADRIKLALGQQPVDLLLKNGRLVNVLSGEIHPASVAIHQGLVVGFGDYEAWCNVALFHIDCFGGFIIAETDDETLMIRN